MKRLIPFVFLLTLPFISCITKTTVMKEVYSEYYTLAEQYYTARNYAKALDFYTRAKGNSELENMCDYKIATTYVQMGDYTSSAQLFSLLLQKDPDNASIMSSLAYVYGKNGSYDKAILLYETILGKYIYDTVSVKNLIILYNHIGNKEKARLLADEYAQKFPQDTQVFNLITEDTTESTMPSSQDDLTLTLD